MKMFEDKESKEMMKILSENKKKGQLKNKQLTKTKQELIPIFFLINKIISAIINI